MSLASQSRRLFCRAMGASFLMRSVADSRADIGKPERPFPVFDGLLYRGKPDTRQHRLVPISGSGDLWRPGVSTEEVDEARISALLEPFHGSSGFYYLDIENWPLLGVAAEARRQTIDKLIRVMNLARRAAPKLHVGFYGLLPGIVYWPLQNHDAAYDEWLKVNRELDPVAQHVDAVFPSLYSFYQDVEGWKNYARQTLREARQYGKPVYPFLWPQFHDSTPLRGTQVPAAYWRAELELCAEFADGVVLWGGWMTDWDEKAPWWRETIAFMNIHGSGMAKGGDGAAP